MQYAVSILSVALIICSSQLKAEGIVNGSFEDHFVGWNIDIIGNGYASIVGGAAHGALCAELFVEAVSGGIDYSTVEMQQTFSASAGDELLFDYDAYDEFYDYSAAVRVSVSTTGWWADDDLNGDGDDSWSEYSLTLPQSGQYTLSFQLSAMAMDPENVIFSNASLLVDNVRINPVPEPASILLLAGLWFWFNSEWRKNHGKNFV